MKVRLTFTVPPLGTRPGNKQVAEDFVITKHLKQHPEGENERSIQEEIDAQPVDEKVEDLSTYFSRDENGNPIMWNYQILGFLKEATLALIESDQFTKEELKKLRLTPYMYKRTLDSQIRIKSLSTKPRQIPILNPGSIEFNERPLRGQTLRGERISLARSEQIQEGASIEFEILSMNDKLWPWLEKCLDYGEWKGLGQWRNAGNGAFTWENITQPIKD